MRWPRGRRLCFALGIWLALAVAVEMAVRVSLPMRGYTLDQVRTTFARRRDARAVPQWRQQEHEHPCLPYYPKPDPGDVELRGLRLTSPQEVKPADVFRAFCLGGSTTYLGYPAKLQSELAPDFAAAGLRLEIVNAGDISWTSAESLIDFELRCLPYEPDAVIIYHGVNDAWPAFGRDYRADYAHWRTRLIPNEPLIWDRLPRFLDHCAAYVQLRAWCEAGTRAQTWARATMKYIPDFERDPYHGVQPYRDHLTSLLAMARVRRIPVLLSTHVVNRDEPCKRYVAAIDEINGVTRTLAGESRGVHFVDADAAIPGSDELMFDICHFRTDRDGEQQLTRLFARSIRAHLEEWTAERSRRMASGGDRMPAGDATPAG
ncbi:MAG: SGNH/GDSL hydrolase family protein [Phycisphaerales bacterium]|nr:SGNH/GDSL hydrolase family protein [Phycisphaerales bacterium]